jgi:thiosulfate/3-mercaptopyruvate sulfurtransferase
MSNRFAHPEVLVSTDWVAQHLNDPNIRLVECNKDVLLYDTGHISSRSTSTGTPT